MADGGSGGMGRSPRPQKYRSDLRIQQSRADLMRPSYHEPQEARGESVEQAGVVEGSD